jgi:outer membrane receptor for ferrienterochelin and colicin
MNKRLGFHLLFSLLALLLATPAIAQNTSAALSGRVTDAAGNAVAGATVEIVHVPSNTVRTDTTDADGHYGALGLRVGGPFKITVSKSGFESAEKQDVYLQLAQEVTLNLALGQSAQQLAGVQVTASADAQIFQSDNKGISTSISQQQLYVIPNPDRSIQSIARMNPFINLGNNNSAGGLTQISALGQNNRYNNILIDSVPTNDNFGLNANGLPGQGQPLSYDWVEAYDISVANYDVTYKRDVGAVIDIVTKSGTNDYHGSVYYDYTNGSDLTANDPVTGSQFGGYQQKYVDGFTFSGPLIKDTLFFFVGYEDQKQVCPCGSSYGPVGSNAANIVNITQDQLTQISSIAQKYGIQTGGLTESANQDQKLGVLKLDWNINDGHRLSFRYSEVDGSQPTIQGNAVGSSGTLGFASYDYTQYQDNKQAVINLYDDWSDSFSTETSLSYSKYYSTPHVLADAPMVRVYVDNNSGPSVYLGEDQFRDYNVVQDKAINGFFAGTWRLGDHSIKAGFDFANDKFYDLFGRTEFGSYTFASISDFAAGNYSSYTLYQPAPGYNIGQIADNYTQLQYGVFLQDTWQATPNFSLQYGIRYDEPQFQTKPLFNSAFSSAFGLSNNATPGTGILEPRVSFNYTFDSDLKTQLRGGAGIVEGAPPGVWLANPYSNNGVNTTSYNSASGMFNPNPFTQTPTASTPPAPEVDVTDPRFKLPSAFKASLGFDRELPWWGLLFSVDLISLQTENGIYYQNLNYGAPTGVLPDGRTSYWSSTDPTLWTVSSSGSASTKASPAVNRNKSYYDVVYLADTNKGSSNFGSVALTKPFNENLTGMVSFTTGKATDVNSGTSSQAASNLNDNAVYNPNENVASPSNYNVKNRVFSTLTWTHHYFSDYLSAISASYDGHTGQPYSWVFGDDASGICYSSSSNCPYALAYIPRPGDVEFTSNTTPQVQQQFFNYIASNPYLSAHQGQVAGRNGADAPWVNQVNLSFSQEIPGIFAGNKGQIKFDIFNFTNLLNKKWGNIYDIDFPYARTLANFAGVDPVTGKYVYALPSVGGNYNPGSLKFENSAAQSQWTLWVTVRYTF